jgi:uncharacterized protein YlbG (UPF0298 family)
MEGTLLSTNDWKDFCKSSIWGSILWELSDRENYLIELFKENDQIWNADTVRGKLTELEFVKQIPQSIIASIAIHEANLKVKAENDDE